MRITGALVLLLALLGGLFGCSSSNGVLPSNEQPQNTLNETTIIGAFDMRYDEDSETLITEPTRDANYHMRVGQYIRNLEVSILSWDIATRIMTVEITVENGTDIDVNDVRCIIPRLGDKKLLNADDYTKLFDSQTPPQANPFRAYAKDEVNRKFWGNYADPDQYIKSEIFVVYFPDEIYATFFFTASIWGNAGEPYEINVINQTGTLYESSGSVDLDVEVLHWKNITASNVLIESNPVTGGDVPFISTGPTDWTVSITNDSGAEPGEYPIWIAAYSEGVPYALYDTITVEVLPDLTTDWSDPIPVALEPGLDEILPRVIIRGNEYWIIYTDGTDVMAKVSDDGGASWALSAILGTASYINRLHAVLGNDNRIYVQYQSTENKYNYNSQYGDSGWSPPVVLSYHGMTVMPYSCDFGVGADGFLYSMTTGSWSTFGFRSVNPYDISAWLNDPIEAMYNGLYSKFDGFVQNAAMPKFFYIHEDTSLDYAWYDAGWQKATLYTGAETLNGPAIAPESDGPIHGAMSKYDGTSYSYEYFRYESWPPLLHQITILENGIGTEGYMSVTSDMDHVAILYDADGTVSCSESLDGGMTINNVDVLASDSTYSHIRKDSAGGKLIAAYAKMEDGDYNIYIRIK